MGLGGHSVEEEVSTIEEAGGATKSLKDAIADLAHDSAIVMLRDSGSPFQKGMSLTDIGYTLSYIYGGNKEAITQRMFDISQELYYDKEFRQAVKNKEVEFRNK